MPATLWALTYERLHGAVDVLVLLQARGRGEGFPTVGAGVCPRAHVLGPDVPLQVTGVREDLGRQDKRRSHRCPCYRPACPHQAHREGQPHLWVHMAPPNRAATCLDHLVPPTFHPATEDREVRWGTGTRGDLEQG